MREALRLDIALGAQIETMKSSRDQWHGTVTSQDSVNYLSRLLIAHDAILDATFLATVGRDVVAGVARFLGVASGGGTFVHVLSGASFQIC